MTPELFTPSAPVLDWNAIQCECEAEAARVHRWQCRACSRGKYSRAEYRLEAIAERWGIRRGSDDWRRLDVMAGMAMFATINS